MAESDSISALSGTVVGGTYRVGRCIGQGAMGTVFEAEHLRLAGRYAVKVLQSDIAAHPELLSRFQREASIMSQLRHPNIVSVLDFNVTPDGRPFLAMELLDGVELTDAIGRLAPLPLSQVIDIVGQIVSALSAAHMLGIVHRDLKPQNLFLLRLPGDEREVVKVLDFGISKVHEATTMLTQANAVMGTPQYMAPEQALGQADLIDHRVDQFALAVITYELLTGRIAFRGDSIPAVLYQVVHEQPVAIRSLNPAIPSRTETVVARAMSKAPSDRFASVREFHAALVQSGQSSIEPVRATALLETNVASAPNLARAEAPSPSPATVTTLGSAAMAELSTDTLAGIRSHRGRTAIGAGALLLLLGGGAWWFGRGSQPPPPETAVLSAPPVPVQPQVANAPPAARATAAPSPVHIIDAPPGLTVTIDGSPASLPLTLPRADRRYELVFAAPHRETQRIVVDGNQPAHEARLVMPQANDSRASATKSASKNIRSDKPAPRTPPTPATRRSRLITDF